MATARARRRDIVYRRPRQRLVIVEKSVQKKRFKERKRRLFFLSVFFGALLILNLSEHALIAQNGFRIQKMVEAIRGEAVSAEKLKLRISYLQNPTRIRAIAMNKLEMIEPTEISYLSFVALRKAKAVKRGSELAKLGLTFMPGHKEAR